MAQIIDVTGLPKQSIQQVESLVNLLRAKNTKKKSEPHNLSPAKLDQVLNNLSKGLPSLPDLPADFCRQDMYGDHD